jgi:hypothetical protein
MTDRTRAPADQDVAMPDPPAANQGKDEPIATTPSESSQSSDGSDDETRADTGPDSGGSMPDSTTGGVPTPGDSQGVAVPSVQAAAGTSEESGAIQDVRTTSLAPPGKPDGEVDTRA